MVAPSHPAGAMLIRAGANGATISVIFQDGCRTGTGQLQTGYRPGTDRVEDDWRTPTGRLQDG